MTISSALGIVLCDLKVASCCMNLDLSVASLMSLLACNKDVTNSDISVTKTAVRSMSPEFNSGKARLQCMIVSRVMIDFVAVLVSHSY